MGDSVRVGMMRLASVPRRLLLPVGVPVPTFVRMRVKMVLALLIVFEMVGLRMGLIGVALLAAMRYMTMMMMVLLLLLISSFTAVHGVRIQLGACIEWNGGIDPCVESHTALLPPLAAAATASSAASPTTTATTATTTATTACRRRIPATTARGSNSSSSRLMAARLCGCRSRVLGSPCVK